MVTLPRDGIRRRPDTKLGQHYLGKPKRCTICKAVMIAPRARQKVCSEVCAEALVEKARRIADKAAALADKRETRAKLEKLKTRGAWIREAQIEFNRFIRLRDQLAGHACISSGRPLDWSGNNVDAGHYRSRGSAGHLRFDERNCHAQSKQENRYASGNVVGYRLGLIQRIGLAAVEALEADQAPRHYSIDDLKTLKQTYAAKARDILKAAA